MESSPEAWSFLASCSAHRWLLSLTWGLQAGLGDEAALQLNGTQTSHHLSPDPWESSAQSQGRNWSSPPPARVDRSPTPSAPPCLALGAGCGRAALHSWVITDWGF